MPKIFEYIALQLFNFRMNIRFIHYKHDLLIFENIFKTIIYFSGDLVRSYLKLNDKVELEFLDNQRH